MITLLSHYSLKSMTNCELLQLLLASVNDDSLMNHEQCL